MSTTTNFRVANLANLFWDNGSYKYPNTYPRLINGWYPKKTPVMTSPTTGWVVLEGDWNYCEFNGNLFFLKKSSLISHKRNKWMYILIKDHICSLFKNRANVIAYGTLVNTDLANLKDNDFQYTFPVFNNYNNRILIPLKEEAFNWRKHSKRIKITKTFEPYCPWTDYEFSDFVYGLENIRDFFTKNPDKNWATEVKKNKYLMLLGSLRACPKKVKGWKQELVEKINALLDEIPTNPNIVAGTITNSVLANATKLQGRVAISYHTDNPLFTVSDETREIDIDLSGLTDIELINFDNPSPLEKYAKDHFNLYLKYDDSKVSAQLKDSEAVTIYKLSRRVRVPFLDRYSSRAIVKTGNKFYNYAWEYQSPFTPFYYPQKIFIKGAKELIPKQGKHHYTNYPVKRFAGENYRSVYLYWCFNLDFYFVWGPERSGQAKSYTSGREQVDVWIKGEDFFRDETKENILRSISEDHYWNQSSKDSIFVIPCNTRLETIEGTMREYPWALKRVKDYYHQAKEWPWNALKEPINIGWLFGQFSTYISGQENQFETEFPFVIKTGVTDNKTLKRLQGFTTKVGDLIHLDELYETSGFTHRYTLDCFNWLTRRQREQTQEEDFLIGEKLLFSCWGMAPYLLFQPFCFTSDWKEDFHIIRSPYGGTAYGYTSRYGYANWLDLEDYNNYQLFGKWIEYPYQAWHYPYVVFDQGSYFKQHAKESYKKAYQNYEALEYMRFYENDEAYSRLKKHIVFNTQEYFTTDAVTIKNTPLEELKVNDIFYSDLEWFWFDASGGKEFVDVDPSDFFFSHQPVEQPMNHGDIVCYINPKDSKVYLGEVRVWDSVMNLPDNQFIAHNPNESIGIKSTVNVKYTRITPASEKRVARQTQGFDNLDTLVEALKEASYLKQNQPKDLKQLQSAERQYLFNLKGTPFFCSLDRKGKVSLIFKNKETYTDDEYIED